MASGIVVSFLGALQASLSVLLTIGVGVAVSQFGLLTTASAEQLSSVCVNVLLPCLLVVNIGSNIDLESAIRYVPIIIWAAVYTIVSLCIGHAVTAFFRLPNWTVPAVAFNNTESLPLLLLQSLGTTGVLASLTGAGGEDAGIDRARSYFLAGSVITNTITFGHGPELLTRSSQDSKFLDFMQWIWYRGKLAAGSEENSDDESQVRRPNGEEEEAHQDAGDEDGPSSSSSSSSDEGEYNGAHERTSLLPHAVVKRHRATRRKVSSKLRRSFNTMPKPLRRSMAAAQPFLNPPFIGATFGIFIGLVPALHRLFFSSLDDGGYFNAWLTSCVKNIGELFVSLQVIVVGVKLSLSLRRMKEGEQAGKVPMGTVIFAVLIRFVVWPAISISVIWLLAAKTNVLPDDPILWFAMMMIPVGPTAMKLLALADVSGASEKTRMAIAKFLTLSYIVTPLVSLSVVGALKASESAIA
ncbi:auxin efflux carrier [Pseudomassariella vexata]|uniref:Auxin efflux carrier n=1 Tax=Pseudomassariella vexata TaxID=1141098 RepID=A0A1Y2DL79_9PEZI|nr:auxin efflux carrier [Pseudomassariella vexata]ORY60068.1 auxin efflux carrier [Pseudomassariella vexata]